MPCTGAALDGTPNMWDITMHPMSAFMLIQYTDSLTRSHIFSIAMWLLCSWCSICVCNEKGVLIHLPFIATLLNITSLCLMGQYPHRVVSKLSLFCGQPLIMYVCTICCSASILITFLISSSDVHTGTSIAMLSVCMLMLIPAILGLSCVIYACCIGVCTALCTVAAEIEF